MENNEWKDKIPFGYYNTGGTLNKIRVDKIPCTLTIKGIRSDITEDNKKTMNLFIELNNFDKFLNKELSVLEIYTSSSSVSLKETRHHINLNNWDFSLNIAGVEVPFDKLLKEFKYKDATNELKDLFSSLTKEGKFFEFGKKTLIEYYLKDEDRFFEFTELFVEKNFSLPDDETKRKELVDFINQGEPGAGTYIEQMIPTVSERKEQLKQEKRRPVRP